MAIPRRSARAMTPGPATTWNACSARPPPSLRTQRRIRARIQGRAQGQPQQKRRRRSRMSEMISEPVTNPFDDGDHLKEECGVFGIINDPEAAAHTALG